MEESKRESGPPQKATGGGGEGTGPKWAGTLLGLLAVAVVGDLLLDVRQGCTARDASERIGKIERRLEGDSDPKDLARSVEDLNDSVADLEDEVGRLGSGTGGSGARGKQLSGGGEVDSRLSALLPGIEDMIDRKVSEQVAGGSQAVERKTAPSMDDLASSIGMSEFQKTQSAQILDGAKVQAMNLVSTPRPDGTTLVSDLQAALLESPTPKQDAMKVLLKMFVEPVPGTDKTYYQSMLTLQDETEAEMGQILTPEQMGKYDAMGVNALSVQTGYNPLMDYFRQVMAAGN